MHQEISFTIAIPAYKGKFLREAIDSCLKQKYASFEIIILDDASPEDIFGICSSFTDSRLKYFRNDVNVGAERVIDNWNKCLALASGTHLICIGDDDRLAPNALAVYSELIGKYPDLNIYHGQTEVIDENGALKRSLPARPSYESVYSLIWNRWNKRKQQYVGDFCYRIEALRCMGGFEFLPLAWGSDDITAVKVAASSGIANTSSICFQYRENDMSISNSHNQEVKMRAVCLEQNWYQSFLANKPDNEEDILLWQKVVAQMPDFYRRKKIYTLWCDFIVAKKSVIKWLLNRSDYGLTLWDIFTAFRRAL